MAGTLGRIAPPNFDHITKYPLATATIETPKAVVLGVNWYEAFDRPQQSPDGSWHIPSGNLGSVRGGHCFSLVPMGKAKYITDQEWTFYNQGQEGACEGFGHSRALTLETGKFFDAFWLYDDARRAEGRYPLGEGASNLGAVQALHKWGDHFESGEVCTRSTHAGPALSVSSTRWTKDAEEVCQALGRPDAYAVPFVNSWGTDYPKVVWLPVNVLERLLSESGEADCTTH